MQYRVELIGQSDAGIHALPQATQVRYQFPGQVLEAELEREHGQAVYEIEIASTTGAVTEITVDAHSGELLSSKIEDDDDDHEYEKSKEKDDD